MIYLLYAIIFLFGLGIGSFLNVLICRYSPEGRFFDLNKLRGRSHCPYCGKTLSFWELIPVLSFVFQGGRCRSCRHFLSLQYPFVEIISGLIFLGVSLYLSKFYGLSESFFWGQASVVYYVLAVLWIIVFLILILMAAIDLRYFVIPNGLNVVLLVLGIIVTAVLILYGDVLPLFRDSFLRNYVLVFSPFESILINHLIGAVLGTVFFGLLWFLSRGRAMGFGDVKLALGGGLLFGWPDIGLALLISFLLGGLWSFIRLILGKSGMKDRIPFAPFLVLGMILTFFLGSQIIQGYFSLFPL